MPKLWSRREALSGIAAGSGFLTSGKVWAQAAGTGQGLLARLQAQKKAKIGVVNQMPYSGVNPDGTLDGIGPALSKIIMQRLGVPEIEGVAGTYGDMVPGMQAGRWDFISASLVITKARCAQILFADPILFDGGMFVFLKGSIAELPKSVADLAAQKLIVGVSQGGAHMRVAIEAGVDQSNLRQFPSDVSTFDGLVAKRIQVAFGSFASLDRTAKLRGLAVETTFPVPDDPEHGSSCAFRNADRDLYDAYQKELRAMKASGEYLPIAQKFGFDTPPSLMPMTAEEACSKST
ncbi:MAG TPA: transporter substrate-binding domain-containing protein [Beijerinckiaceae bacterium]|jgi:polar amino acid transport system substrate-binding protein|nr:transporter substrate-binding domain-containing protein [Beijerinckiaceae bacterium]